MELIEQKYDLADSRLIDTNSRGINLMLWKPDKRAVVIGNSNKAEKTVDLGNVQKDNVPVYKRPSGGESVVLTENMMIISIVNNMEKFEGSRKLFDIYNELIISALSRLGIENLGMKGISDITIGNKKILGSAMYRNKDKTFYHAVLNIAEDIDVISRYLYHPEREPDYRQGRGHSEFVTSIRENYKNVDFDKIKSILVETFTEYYENNIQVISN